MMLLLSVGCGGDRPTLRCRRTDGVSLHWVVSRSPELSLGLALQRLCELRVAVAAPESAFGEIGLTAQPRKPEPAGGSVDARRQAVGGQPTA